MKYVCDFETTSGDTWLAKDNGVARVWAYCCCTIEKEPKITKLGNSMDDFMAWLLKGQKQAYFHNLAYDGEYIISWLYNNGYKYVEDSRDMKPKEFSALISDMGLFYNIDIKLAPKKHVKLYDSLKIIPLSVKEIAKAWNLEISKGEIDYEMYRKVGYKLTEEEKDYIKRDVKIVAYALHDFLSLGYDKITIGANALATYKDMLRKNAFDNLFPQLPINVDNDIRLSYKGGFVYLNPKYRNKRLKGISFDVNSLYPYEMYDKVLPYGLPIFFKGKYKSNPKYPLYIQRLNCRFVLKEGYLPTIQLKHNPMFKATEYITDSLECVDMVLTSVDLELFLKHYDVYDIIYLGGYMFKGCKGLFKDYIEHFMDIKMKSEGGMRQIAKLFLNSLYGKFATNPIRVSKHLEFKDGIVVKHNDKGVEGKTKYTALASFITAYARRDTISSAQLNYDRFIYADTDSISLVGYDEPTNINIDNKKLGYWKNEGIFTDSIFLKPKTYLKLKEDGLHITCCGMPNNIKEGVNFDNFKYGITFDGKLAHYITKGGCILHKTTFTIKAPRDLDIEKEM